ncbi:hypothetical protein BCY89_27695 [Sphingobacterium siyangense]|uniref:Uncharacterized protein n=1 Tax=Sphingobacterium siyangense TaxID=459529 RepID=A0A420FXK0_9SPHI|nr:hypothetical protein [Sphingobacterium siyangense]RKF37665.1 hypothetical protein BCY89_27695 [Sphingobacterium siyangense]
MALNHLDSLKQFFLKVLTVQKSLQSINHSWLENIKTSVVNHIFPDPINFDIQDDKKQVDYFNQLLGTDDSAIKWTINKSSKCRIVIDENNRESISAEFLSNIYCQLSVPVFEHICVLLKELSESQSGKSIHIINKFDIEFRDQLIEIDNKKNLNTPTIQIFHNLRLFRNCITHSGCDINELENSFNMFNDQIENNKNYKRLKFYGALKKESYHYSINEKAGKIQLNNSSFLKLLDLYSQLAYIVYLCYCNKNNIRDEFSNT